jgi:hypothetical protein
MHEGITKWRRSGDHTPVEGVWGYIASSFGEFFRCPLFPDAILGMVVDKFSLVDLSIHSPRNVLRQRAVSALISGCNNIDSIPMKG